MAAAYAPVFASLRRAWLALGTALISGCGLLTLFSDRFGYAHTVADMPVMWLAGALVLAGLLFLLLPPLIRRSRDTLPAPDRKRLLWAVLAAGLAMRAILFASEPALEDDYQRYLWDGAVTAHGLDPYALSPQQAREADPRVSPYGRLALQSGQTIGRVNHPELRTVYPPVAQAAFALAHRIAPFSLAAWRGLVLLCDIAALVLLLMLLQALGRAPLWAALYWWNPLLLKELYNSAHMEALLLPLLLGALLLAIRNRAGAATGTLLLAAGVKIWPALLLPLVWRPLLKSPLRLALTAAASAAVLCLLAAPMLLAGLGHASGLRAYATEWGTNNALMPLLDLAAGWIAGLAAIAEPGLLPRAAVAVILGLLALGLARRPLASHEDLISRAFLLVAALLLLSPAQFPWYYLWLLPLLALRPVPGFLLLTATMPFYYAAFFFLARDQYALFKYGVVWAVWLPVWAMLLKDAWPRLRGLARPSSRLGEATA